MRTSDSFLRKVLLLDASVSGASAAALLAGAATLEPLLGLPAPFLRSAGAICAVFALFVAAVASQTPVSRRGAWAVIIMNTLWVIDSVVVLAAGFVHPAASGTVFVIAQAIGVAALAELEYTGLRRQTRAA